MGAFERLTGIAPGPLDCSDLKRKEPVPRAIVIGHLSPRSG